MNGAAVDVPRESRSTHAWRARVGVGLSIASVVLACLLSLFRDMPVPVNTPAILVAGSLFLLLPLRSDGVATVQRIVGLYLISIPIDQLSHQYTPAAWGVHVSFSVPIILVAVLGAWIGSGGQGPSDRDSIMLRSSWNLAVGVLVAHMLGVLCMLRTFYGYGYEHDAGALGSVALVLLVFLLLWPCLKSVRARQLVGVTLCLYYISVAIRLGQS